MQPVYIVKFETDGNKPKFLCSGEYSRFGYTNVVRQALQFETIESAKSVLTHSEFTEDCVFPEASCPPIMIHNVLGLCYSKPKAKGKFKIIKVEFSEVFETEISGEIIRHKYANK